MNFLTKSLWAFLPSFTARSATPVAPSNSASWNTVAALPALIAPDRNKSDTFLLSLLSGLSESFLPVTNLLFENMARKAWGHKLQLRLCIVLSPWKVPHNLQIAIWKHVDTKVWVICWTNKLAAEAWVAPPQRRCGSSKPQLLLNEQKECVSGASTKIAAQCRKHTIILWGRWKANTAHPWGRNLFLLISKCENAKCMVF